MYLASKLNFNSNCTYILCRIACIPLWLKTMCSHRSNEASLLARWGTTQRELFVGPVGPSRNWQGGLPTAPSVSFLWTLSAGTTNAPCRMYGHLWLKWCCFLPPQFANKHNWLLPQDNKHLTVIYSLRLVIWMPSRDRTGHAKLNRFATDSILMPSL